MTDGLSYLAAIALALVFGYSAIVKFRDAYPTRRALKAVGLPVGVARVVPYVEIAVALMLFAMPAVGAVFALGVLVLFTGFICYLLARRIDISCGCFGANMSRSVSSMDVVRNVMLMALAGVAMGAERPSDVVIEEVIVATTAFAIGVVVLTAMGTRRDLGQLFDNRLPGER